MPSTIEIAAGDTFFVPDRNGETKRHLCIAVTGTAGAPPQVIIVPLATSRDWSDNTVELEVADHPFVKTKTIVDFRFSRCELTSKIERALERGSVRRSSAVSPSILSRVREGLLRSPFTPTWIVEKFRSLEVQEPETKSD